MLKQESVAKVLKLKEEYDLCDIWRVRNWKFNNLLINDEKFTNTFKIFIQKMISKPNINISLDGQLNMKSRDLQYPIVSNVLKKM